MHKKSQCKINTDLCGYKPFSERLGTAPVGGGFYMEDWWVWCGSVIKDPEGTYHMYASRWSKSFDFFAGYKVSSEIIRAESSTADGPYVYKETLLGDRGEQFWDGRMTHNPKVLKIGDVYVLFYIGARYTGSRPDPNAPDDVEEKGSECYNTIRIGFATAHHPAGPWIRPEEPCLEVRPDKWDSNIVTNPSPMLRNDGSIFLYYRSNTSKGLRIGLASTSSLDRPFKRLQDDPILALPGNAHVEDPFAWQNERGNFEMLAKDMTGTLTGEFHAGCHLLSEDGVDWSPAPVPLAYSRKQKWSDGTQKEFTHLERPELFFDDPTNPQRPTHFFAATSTGGEAGTWNFKNSWTMVINLE